MSKRIVVGAVVGITTLLWGQPIGAGGTLEIRTDPSFGPNSTIFDTATGLTWLNLEYTDGLSYNEVTGEMSPGGTFARFTYATSAQVATLFADGIPGNTDYSVDSPAIASFMSTVGSTGTQNGYPYCDGEVFTVLPDQYNTVGSWLLDVSGRDGVFGYTFGGGPGYGVSYADAFGSWLIMAVPEPEVWCLVPHGGAVADGNIKEEASQFALVKSVGFFISLRDSLVREI